MTLLQDIAAFASGGAVGFLLGLLGGGGSVLAVPLLMYVVGVPSAHIAIGTSALGVSANALTALAAHARKGTVKWPCAITLSVFGAAGAATGATLGRAVPADTLLLAFACAMLLVAFSMFRPTSSSGDPSVRITPTIAVKIAGTGFLAGVASGFFGIGGGFLIVPGLMLSSGMPMISAIGSSLVSVFLFGLTTAATYAVHGEVNWEVASLLVCGGALGSLAGARLSQKLANKRALLQRLFAGLIVAVAVYMASRVMLA